MHSPYEVPGLSTTCADAHELDVDLIIVPVAKEAIGEVSSRFGSSVGPALAAAAERGEFSGAPADMLTVQAPASGWRAARVLFVGAGPRHEITSERFRRVAVSAAHGARKQRMARAAWMDLEHGALSGIARAEAVAESFTLANFDNGVHKSRHDDAFFVRQVVLAAQEDVAAAGATGVAMGESINGARVLINEPGNYLTPRVMAEKAAALAGVPGISAEVLDEKAIASLNMGLLLGVARGSAEPPRVLVLKYDPAHAPTSHVLGLVGKGITFDTGGISIKPSDGMERMKDDMAGGASVVAALRAIALQRLPIRALAVVPMTENMPGGRALKPGDIITGASGLTVEVNNTDAEGRLILGDGLWYARQLGATHLIDVATLTGAVVVALGKITTGLFGTPQPWVDHIRSAADRAGEKLWQLPLFDDYKDQLKSEIADMLNSPGRPAGSVTAAMFLKEFAGTGPWAHLDIAGTAWAEEAKPWQPKGATGAMIRTLIEVARGGFAG